eukprot:TRINITY_DN563_c4_g1_i1.p1 TRINITY_DN563_c4_g1~~TRINITY_DN563_c4_g1_i1.p1  ORF type:complete len:172 (+),score=21.20 TRINITY_DN563_c4_g1_i1:40-555(+)
MLRRCTMHLAKANQVRPSETYLHEGELAFDKHKKVMREKVGMPREERNFRITRYCMTHPTTFRDMKDISDNTPIQGEDNGFNAGAFPTIAAIFMAFYAFYYYLMMGQFDGKRLDYLTPDPNRVSKCIRFAPDPVGYGPEPLVNEANHGGFCIIRPDPDLTKILTHPLTASH